MKILATLVILTLVTVGIAGTASYAGKPGEPGGVDGSVQFNDVGTLGGSFDLRWDKTTNTLHLNNGNLDLSGSVVQGVLWPVSDDSYDIGSESNSWAGLYLGADEVIYFGNVPVIAQEVGQGDTYINANVGKKVRIQKPLILEGLPTFDPHSPGHVRNDNGVLKISN